MCSSYGYKSLPYVLGLISLIEMVLGIIRIVIFFGEKPSVTPTALLFYKAANTSKWIASPLLSSTQAKTAFAIDWIASIIPTFMGIYVLLFMIVAGLSLCLTCCCIIDAGKNTAEDVRACSNCCKYMCRMCTSKPNHRCVSLTWNCPCYKARPKLRFQVRFGLLIFFIVLRIIAIILYATDKTVSVYGRDMAIFCALSVGLVFLMMAVDFYQYRVWWYYRPDGAYKRGRCCYCKQHFYPAHQRFLPAPLLGKYREENTTGDRPCLINVSGDCSDLSLEHIVIFHAFDFKPLRRYRLDDVDKTYIGFHRTIPESAVGISKTGFRISSKPPQMLGYGVYFARSFKILKARLVLPQLPQLKEAIIQSHPDFNLEVTLGIGYDRTKKWLTEAFIPFPNSFTKFIEKLGPTGKFMSSTGGDLFIDIRSTRKDLCYELGRLFYRLISDKAVAQLDDTFGFEDGNDNPHRYTARAAAALIGLPYDEPIHVGGSIALTQKWHHNLTKWNENSQKQQEDVIGRTKGDGSEELDPEIPTSHIGRVELEIDDIDIEILRRSLPHGDMKVNGLFFVAYASNSSKHDKLLDNMVGNANCIYDRLMDFTAPVTGNFWFIPSISVLEKLFNWT